MTQNQYLMVSKAITEARSAHVIGEHTACEYCETIDSVILDVVNELCREFRLADSNFDEKGFIADCGVGVFK